MPSHCPSSSTFMSPSASSQCSHVFVLLFFGLLSISRSHLRAVQFRSHVRNPLSVIPSVVHTLYFWQLARYTFYSALYFPSTYTTYCISVIRMRTIDPEGSRVRTRAGSSMDNGVGADGSVRERSEQCLETFSARRVVKKCGQKPPTIVG